VKVYFDVRELYYIPQYTPICSALEVAGVQCCFVFYQQGDFGDLISSSSLKCEIRHVEGEDGAISLYQAEKPDWVILGTRSVQSRSFKDM